MINELKRLRGLPDTYDPEIDRFPVRQAPSEYPSYYGSDGGKVVKKTLKLMVKTGRLSQTYSVYKIVNGKAICIPENGFDTVELDLSEYFDPDAKPRD